MAISVVKLLAAAAGALAGTAVARELNKPPDQRAWHGEVAGVPYDFRTPTADKLRKSVWDPDNPKLMVPMTFGVGWSVNLARVAAWAQQPPVEQPPPAKEITDGT